jgi:signal transduction histidine kinase
MHTPTIIRMGNPRRFDIAVYVTVTVLTVVSVTWLPYSWARLPTVVLCLAYGMMYWLGYYAIHTQRQAVLYFGTQTLLLTGLVLLGGLSDVFGLLFFVLGIQAVMVMPKRRAIMWLLLLYLIQSSVGVWYRFPEGIINVVFNIAVYVLTYVFAATVRQAEIARMENEQLLVDLRLAQRQLHDLAVAEERNRLARDLHDSVKQQVFATTMQLGAARVLLERDPHPVLAQVVEAEQLVKQAGAELSLLIHELRPAALGDKGLAEALHAYSTDWSRQTGIATTMQTQNERPLPPATEHALLRVTQEALANVSRHSQATTVTIDVLYSADAVLLQIADDGRGFDAGTIRKGVGLDSMRERIEGLGGCVQVESQIGGGTRISVHCGGTNA